MYKNKVENDRNIFEIPALLSCERGNSAENGAGKIQNIYVILNFPALDFLICKGSLPYFYTYPTLPFTYPLSESGPYKKLVPYF